MRTNKVRFMDHISQESIDKMIPCFKPTFKNFKQGETILTYSDNPQQVCILLEGKAKLYFSDIDGDYGHTAHVTFSWLGRPAVERAGNAAEHPASAQQYGVWEVPKTYIHLYGENQLRMDWHQPLEAFDGLTGLEVASKAFAWHVTQQERWAVHDGGAYDNALFGLWRTTVGQDVVKNDLFENIPAE